MVTLAFENSSAIAIPTEPLFLLLDFASDSESALPVALKAAIVPAVIVAPASSVALTVRCAFVIAIAAAVWVGSGGAFLSSRSVFASVLAVERPVASTSTAPVALRCAPAWTVTVAVADAWL